MSSLNRVLDAMIPAIIAGPPGLTTITSSFLFMSFTAKFLFSKILINGGVMTNTTTNATMHEITAGISKSINYLTLRNSAFMLSAMVEPILSISANLFTGIFFRSSRFFIPCLNRIRALTLPIPFTRTKSSNSSLIP